MTDTKHSSESNQMPPRHRPRPSRSMLGGALIAVLAIGAAAGASGARIAQRWQPQSVLLLQSGPIDKMTDASVVAVKGSVAEIFGNKFILQDGSGRALVDTGPRGEGSDVVAKGETITVQGRFDRGVIHAAVIAHADGRSEAFGPPPPPPPPPGADRGPPPPPPADAERAPPPADQPQPPPDRSPQ